MAQAGLKALPKDDGRVGAYAEPREHCPFCGTLCEADWVDVGVGSIQCGPYYCTTCYASERGPHDSERILKPIEMLVGWYAPGAEVGDSANTFQGIPVDHRTAKRLYSMGMLDKKEKRRGSSATKTEGSGGDAPGAADEDEHPFETRGGDPGPPDDGGEREGGG